MSWFSEQIEERKREDEQVLRGAYESLDTAVTGRTHGTGARDTGTQLASLYSDILRYFHKKDSAVNHDFREAFDAVMETDLVSQGILLHEAEAETGWYKANTSLQAARWKDTGEWVLIYPGKLSGYVFRHPETGKNTRLNAGTEKLFEDGGYVFYLGFPTKSLHIPDLIAYMAQVIRIQDLILLLGLLLIITLIGMLTPRISHFIYSDVLESGSVSLLVSTALFLLLVNVVTALFTAFRSIVNTQLSMRMNMQVSAATMSRVFSLPAAFFRNYSAGELSRKIDSIQEICSSIVNSVFSVSVSALFSLLYVVQLFQYAPGIAIPALIVLIVTAAYTVVITLVQRKLTLQQILAEGKVSGLSYALVNGIQKIRLSGSENRVFAKWADAYSERLKLTYRPPFLLKHSGNFSVMIALIGQIVLYVAAIQSRLTVADYNAFMTAYAMVSAAFSAVVGVASSIAGIQPMLEVAKPIMENVPEASEGRHMVSRLQGNVELNNIRFRYEPDEPYVLNRFSLKIRRGEYVAVVGKSGCGKSTLVRLLLGFEKPESGAVYYDGQDLAQLDLRSLRRNIGTVMQDGKLFQGDLLSNITVAAPLATEEDAWKAAEIAGIADDIRRMPMHMQTMIASGGGGISGGQRQRIMIARAVVGNPKILIFDEATSALDNTTQRHISEALDSLSCTRIIIAHRLSTIKRCDRIIFLEDGAIAEEGTYDELMQKDGKFADLVRRQTLDLPEEAEENTPKADFSVL